MSHRRLSRKTLRQRSELVLDNTRPSWENNLNWWIDGNDAVEALEQMPSVAEPSATQPSVRGVGPTGSTGAVRVSGTQAGTRAW